MIDRSDQKKAMDAEWDLYYSIQNPFTDKFNRQSKIKARATEKK